MTTAEVRMPDPRAAFVVTCYNLGEFLGEALASIRAQTISSWELVIVDDGSDDGETIRTLDGLRGDGFRVVRTSNRGLPAARNTGILSTSAGFICCLDADDRLRPNFLERSIAVLDASPQVAFASHWLRTFGDEEADWSPARCDFPSLLDMNSVNGAALVRRRAVEAVGGFDESFVDGCEDWDFWISLVEAGYPGTIIPEVLFDYRRRPGSMSRRMIEQIGHPEMYERLVRKHAATYRTYLIPLLLRREATLVELSSQVFDIELEAERHLGPELQGLRDDARLIHARQDASRRELRSAAELAALRDRLSSSESEILNREQEIERTSRQLHEYEARAHRAEQEVTSLRSSFSWRLTGPLRRIYAFVLRLES